MELKVMKLVDNAIIPTRGSEKASGFDLYALEDTKFLVGETKIINTGIAFGIPDGYEIQIRPRSGLSLKTPLRIANTPGTIDADFTGPCGIVMNMISGSIYTEFHIKRGDRIAQAVLCPVVIPDLVEVTSLEKTERAEKGFGSTGV